MNNDLIEFKQSIPALAMDESELINVLQTSLYPGAQLQSIKMVIGYCRAAQLDPMQKPVHIVPMWDKTTKQMRDVIMPGVGLYRTQAARSKELAGISEPEFGPDIEVELSGQKIAVPEWCKVTVKRQLANGSTADFTAIEYWLENYATAGKDSDLPNTMWRKRKRGQLAKCTQAQALRMGFPEMVGSAPTADEMEGKYFDAEDVRGEVTVKTLPQYSDNQMNANLATWQSAIEAGHTNPQRIIAMISTKFTLSETQMETIRNLEKQELLEVNGG